MNYFNPNSEFIEIGDHLPNRGFGDVLTLTSVIREVNKKYPNKKIIIKTLGDKQCFLNNNRIFEIKNELLDHSIDAPIEGHYILKKCFWFGIQDPSYRTELFISDSEELEATTIIKQLSQSRPAILFSPNSTDRRRDWTPENWEKLVKVISLKYDVYQIDRESHNCPIWLVGTPNAPAAEPKRTINSARQELRGIGWRKAMALMKVCAKYLGTNTGFLPMANAFGANHFVFHDTRFVNPTEWAYPDNHNFTEETDINDVIREIQKYWMDNE